MNHTRPKRKATKAGTRNAWLPGSCGRRPRQRGRTQVQPCNNSCLQTTIRGESIFLQRENGLGGLLSPSSSLAEPGVRLEATKPQQSSCLHAPKHSNYPTTGRHEQPDPAFGWVSGSELRALTCPYFQTHSQTTQAALKLHTDLRLTLKSVLTLLLLPPKHRTG